MRPEFDELALDLAKRQYFFPEETSISDMFRRVVDTVYPHDDKAARVMYDYMINKEFCPGGRILAGAGTQHGNLLNCFVQDGSPEEPGSTAYAMALAKKLALVTKVGGGNGINLDPFPPRQSAPQRYFLPDVYLSISAVHPDFFDVESGTFFDLTQGKRVHRNYKAVDFAESRAIPTWTGTLITVEDSLESIWDSAALMVQAIQEGRSVLVDLDKLRPEGTPVKGSGGTSSGPASFAVEIFDNFAYWAYLGGAERAGPVATLRYVFAPTLRCIRQGGVRRGAGMATLSAGHSDIIDFIHAKKVERENADGDISTFNISVLMPDSVIADVTNTLPEIIADQAWETGEPGLIFIDTVNQHNLMHKTDGDILATNPCGEVPLYPGESCDLGAINVSAFVDKHGFNWGMFELACGDALRFLDAVLDAEVSPLPEIDEQIRDKRRLGLGVMGVADALIRLGIEYGSAEGIEFVNSLAETMTRVALGYTHSHAPSRGPRRAGYARHNVALLTVAPTGTTSMLFGVSSGIEPLFAPFMYRRIGTEYKKILHPLFKEVMEQYQPGPYLCTWEPVTVKDANGIPFAAYRPGTWDWDEITKRISKAHGSVQDIVGIPDEVARLFQCAHDLTPEQHILIQAAMQAGFDEPDYLDNPSYVGNSISKTINFQSHHTPGDICDAFILANELGCKGVTVYRDGSRTNQVLNMSMGEDDGSTLASQAADKQLEELLEATCTLDGSCDT